MCGDRLSESVSLEDLKLAAGIGCALAVSCRFCSWAKNMARRRRFPTSSSHSDPELIEAVRRGRRMEFAAFEWQGEMPDPQDETTFLSAKLRHELRAGGTHQTLLEFYRELIRLRKTLPALEHLAKESMEVVGCDHEKVLVVQRWHGTERALLVANLQHRQGLLHDHR